MSKTIYQSYPDVVKTLEHKVAERDKQILTMKQELAMHRKALTETLKDLEGRATATRNHLAKLKERK